MALTNLHTALPETPNTTKHEQSCLCHACRREAEAMRRRETAWAKASLDLPFLVKQPQADTRQPASAAVGVAASKQPKPESKSSNKSQIGDIYRSRSRDNSK